MEKIKITFVFLLILLGAAASASTATTKNAGLLLAESCKNFDTKPKLVPGLNQGYCIVVFNESIRALSNTRFINHLKRKAHNKNYTYIEQPLIHIFECAQENICNKKTCTTKENIELFNTWYQVKLKSFETNIERQKFKNKPAGFFLFLIDMAKEQKSCKKFLIEIA